MRIRLGTAQKHQRRNSISSEKVEEYQLRWHRIPQSQPSTFYLTNMCSHQDQTRPRPYCAAIDTKDRLYFQFLTTSSYHGLAHSLYRCCWWTPVLLHFGLHISPCSQSVTHESIHSTIAHTARQSIQKKPQTVLRTALFFFNVSIFFIIYVLFWIMTKVSRFHGIQSRWSTHQRTKLHSQRAQCTCSKGSDMLGVNIDT